MNRRKLFRSLAAAAATAAVAPFSLKASTTTSTPRTSPLSGTSRAERVYQARLRAAEAVRTQSEPAMPVNGDEERYPLKWGRYSKGLPHDALGNPDAPSYKAYLEAVLDPEHERLERIPLGGYLKLANPQAAHSIDLVGPDSSQLAMPAPPAFASAWQAAELTELYWHAALRDVPFAAYDTDPLVARACTELNKLSDYRGPKAVTPATLFRGNSVAARRGPYVSQFLVRDVAMAPIRVQQKIRTATPGHDWMTEPSDWLNIQNGQLAPVPDFDKTPRYTRSGRDLSEYMHRDFTYQVGMCATAQLFKMSAPLDGGVPYQYSITQGGFVTFGASDIFHLVATVANLSLKAAWYQKWLVHRHARPEELGGRVHFAKTKKERSPLHREILEADVLGLIHDKHKSFLLPQAHPQGSPAHPAYPSGHAVIAGACATVLKACFAESWVLPGCVTPSPDGLTLQPYKNEELTVGGELDKMAENVAFGRNFAGVHWRFDAIEGLLLGEAYAIRYLQELKLMSPEVFTGFSLTRFDGKRVTV
ncbi:MAG TPA: vanadium-dependent haloperoxidase [Thermoanaerobaculia bacterium]